MDSVIEIVGASPNPHPCCGEVYGHESTCTAPTDVRLPPRPTDCKCDENPDELCASCAPTQCAHCGRAGWDHGRDGRC